MGSRSGLYNVARQAPSSAGLYNFARKNGLLLGICDGGPLAPCFFDPSTLRGTPFVSRKKDRGDPATLLPGVRHVVVVGRPYAAVDGALSSLGYGVDYHAALTAHLQVLAALFPATTRYAMQVDSGPLYERGFALKAGLGLRGCNGMVIATEAGVGSYFNMGLLLVDGEIPGVAPSRGTVLCCEHCGACRGACPGAAIDANGVDPLRCVSYISQKPGPLSPQETALLQRSGQLYGCDLCQRVCPHNRAVPVQPQAVLPQDFLQMDAAAFCEKYGKTAMAWRGLETIKRNARVSVG